ncbi:MAG: AbrB/MazE/SpoVT family DNA-binding domain-containing protein [Bifidobacteriaceae bacterium]|jgi:AbrB family looped-hinge helix DNA binding protein|nr:AbrB/MazE/SpoVT family DNA-binding domain-containing protein [Bifidobacteriaceae bacterium]
MSKTDWRRGDFPWHQIPHPAKIYGTATVGERGQISIPAEARKQLSIQSGDRLVVFGNTVNGSLILVSADVFEDFADFFLTKINKLGEQAEAFFGQFTRPAATDAEDDPDTSDSQSDASPDSPSQAEPTGQAAGPNKPKRGTGPGKTEPADA